MGKKKSNKISKFQQQIRKKDKPIVSRTLPTRQICKYVFLNVIKILSFSAILVAIGTLTEIMYLDLAWLFSLLIIASLVIFHFLTKKEVYVLSGGGKRAFVMWLSFMMFGFCIILMSIFVHEENTDIAYCDSVQDIRNKDADVYVFKNDCFIDTTMYGEYLERESNAESTGAKASLTTREVYFMMYYVAPIKGVENVCYVREVKSESISRHFLESSEKENQLRSSFLKSYGRSMRPNSPKIQSRAFRVIINQKDLKCCKKALEQGLLSGVDVKNMDEVCFLEEIDTPQGQDYSLLILLGGIFVYSFVLFLIYRFSAIIVPPTPFAWGDCKHK